MARYVMSSGVAMEATHIHKRSGDDNNRDAVAKFVGVGSSRYRLVALDLDGTLLESKSREMSQATVSHLQSLLRRGVPIAFCTGRSIQSVLPHVQRLGLQNPFPLVAANGSLGVLVRPDCSIEHLFSHALPMDVAHRVFDIAKARGYLPLWYHENTIWAHPSGPRQLRMIKNFEVLSKSKVVICKNPVRPSDMKCHPHRVVIVVSRGGFAKAVDVLTKKLQDDLAVAPLPGMCCIELLGANVNKGVGLANLCDKLQVSVSDCIAIGDGDNDVEFLKIAGLGVCMKNGTDRARQAADAVTEWTNNQDGVVKTLECLEDLDLLPLEERARVPLRETSTNWFSPDKIRVFTSTLCTCTSPISPFSL